MLRGSSEEAGVPVSDPPGKLTRHSRGHFRIIVRDPSKPEGRIEVAKKTVLVCDKCDSEVPEGKGRHPPDLFADARRRSKQADLCDACADGLPGTLVPRRGRRPKSALAG